MRIHNQKGFKMSRKSFISVQDVLVETVYDLHDGAWIATRQEVIDFLKENVDNDVPKGCIDRFHLCLSKGTAGKLASAGYVKESDQIVVLYNPGRFTLFEAIGHGEQWGLSDNVNLMLLEIGHDDCDPELLTDESSKEQRRVTA